MHRIYAIIEIMTTINTLMLYRQINQIMIA